MTEIQTLPDTSAPPDRLPADQAPVPRPSVSVLLCNYNHAQFLPFSLGAIVSQTRPADEIIIVDDGSTDNSLDIIDSFVRSVPNIRLIRHDRNQGLMAAIATALNAARTEYLVWAASDDRLLPRFLEKGMDLLARHPEAGICFSRLHTFTDRTLESLEYVGSPTTGGKAFDLGTEPRFLSAQDLWRRWEEAFLWMSSNTVIFHRERLRALGDFRPAMRWYAESFVFLALAARHGACVIPESLAMVREVPGTYSSAGMADPVQQRQVHLAYLDALAEPGMEDVRRIFRARPCLFSAFGGRDFLEAMRSRRRDWDLALAYFQWNLDYQKNCKRDVWLGQGSKLARLKSLGFAAGAGLVDAVIPRAWREMGPA